MKTKVLILRGITGSGKSTYITERSRSGTPSEPLPVNWRVFSADDYWSKDGPYTFDPARIGEAHAWCCFNYLECLHLLILTSPPLQLDLIIVDNTNISTWEIAPYMLAAAAYGCEAEIVTLYCDPAIAAQRNIHQVPPQVVLNMHQRLLKEQLPGHWKHTVIFN